MLQIRYACYLMDVISALVTLIATYISAGIVAKFNVHFIVKLLLVMSISVGIGVSTYQESRTTSLFCRPVTHQN